MCYIFKTFDFAKKTKKPKKLAIIFLTLLICIFKLGRTFESSVHK